MVLPYEPVQTLHSCSSKRAWDEIFQYAWKTCTRSFGDTRPEAEVTRRDRAVGEIDLFLATAGWDLWAYYEADTPRASLALQNWWESTSNGRAVLILDALSLRECPWILQEAPKRGFEVISARPTGAELPADTTPFAKALGFGQRSSLNNNGAGSTHKLPGARTESADIAWRDCADQVGAEPDWVFWHHWPDHRLHEHDDPGKGLTTLVREVRESLTGDDFWALVERLATGRRLLITADHGYAASGLFPDSTKEETAYLKRVFKSGRWESKCESHGAWVPPIDLSLDTDHGKNVFVNGRRKWKSSGGYPTLTHGGLSVLEVAVPFIELSKQPEHD